MNSTEDEAWTTAVSIVYFVVPSLIFVVYMMINYLFLVDNELKRMPSYRLMLHLGLFDCLQLLTHASAGFLTFFPSICEESPYICKFLGATLNTAWVGLFPVSVLTAVHRLQIVTRMRSSDDKLSWYMKLGLFLGWMYFLAFYICCLTLATVTYYPEAWAWSYAGDELSMLMGEIEFFVSIPSIFLMFLIYLAVIFSLMCTQRVGDSTVKFRKHERNILLQSLILFVNLTLLICCWHYYELILPSTKYTFFVINLYWIFYCGLNPLIYLTMTTTIRVKFVNLFCSKLKPNPTRVTVSSRAAAITTI